MACGTSHFYLFFFSLLFWQGLVFWNDNIGLWLGKPSPGQKRIFFLIGRTSYGKVMPHFRFCSRITLSKRYLEKGPGHVAQSVGHLTRKSEVLGSIPGLAIYFCFFLPLIQEGQLSVTGENMCTKYCLTAYEV